MLRVSQYLGNIRTDSIVADKLAQWERAGKLEEVAIDEREASKSRLRLRTSKGRELGLFLPRGTKITDGDVFALDSEEGGVLIHLSLQEVMVLTPLPCPSATERLRRAVRLGHVLGNQHWPVAVVEEQVLVPVSLDRAVMETVLKTHHLTSYFFIQYEQRPWPQEEEEHSWMTHH